MEYGDFHTMRILTFPPPPEGIFRSQKVTLDIEVTKVDRNGDDFTLGSRRCDQNALQVYIGSIEDASPPLVLPNTNHNVGDPPLRGRQRSLTIESSHSGNILSGRPQPTNNSSATVCSGRTGEFTIHSAKRVVTFDPPAAPSNPPESSDMSDNVTASSWTVGDFNGDGRTDIYFLWTDGNDGRNRLYLSRGDGTFDRVLDPIVRGEIDNESEWTIGDFNGDGRTDIYFLWTDGNDGRNRLYLSQGNGMFARYLDPISPESIDEESGWAVGDFNGDGRTDIYFLWPDGNDGRNRLYLSQGNGTFSSHFDPIVRGEIDNESSWTVGDFNGDGRTDIYFLWTDGNDGRNRLYLSQGNGTFARYLDPISPESIDEESGWAVGDFNGDGRTDIYFLWPDGNDGRNRLYLSQGNGTFSSHFDPIVRGEIDNESSWTVGDFNGDGRTDIYFLWTGGNNGTNRLYLSQGNGTFSRYLDPISPVSIDEDSGWAVGDFNGNGPTDIYFLWTDEDDGRNRLYLSQGNGTFSSFFDPIIREDIDGD